MTSRILPRFRVGREIFADNAAQCASMNPACIMMRWQILLGFVASSTVIRRLRYQHYYYGFLGDTAAAVRSADGLLRMATRDDQPPTTTNAEDQREAAKLRERLRQKKKKHKHSIRTAARHPRTTLPSSVEIDEGTHKYVLIRALVDDDDGEGGQRYEYIVTSRRGASYHRNAAEPMIARLEAAGGYYHDIEVTGGGRISYNASERKIHIYGFSYGFGQANHAIAQRTVREDPRYKDYTVTISNDGY